MGYVALTLSEGLELFLETVDAKVVTLMVPLTKFLPNFKSCVHP